MSTKAFTFPEVLVASSIGSIVLLTTVTMMVHMAHASRGIQHYSEFEKEGRIALDHFTRDVRQANAVSSFSSNSIVLDSPTGLISYTFVPEAHAITRQDSTTLTIPVHNCISCEFKIFQRNPPTAGYDQFIPTTDLRQAKLVEADWQSATTNGDGSINSSTTQSAKVVIRKL